MPTTITRTKIHETLGPVVAAAGEGYVQNECVYFSDGTGDPACLVGQMLPSLGIKAADIFEQELNYEVSAHELLNSMLFKEREIRAEAAAALELQLLQALQDEGRTWKSVLSFAESLSDEELLALALGEVKEGVVPSLDNYTSQRAFEAWLYTQNAE